MRHSTFVATVVFLGACTRGVAEDNVKACEARSPISCSQNIVCRTIYGFGYDQGRTCREQEATAIGCVAKEVACTEMTTYAQNPDGHAYELASTCMPAGWTSATAFVRAWPPCAR